MDDDSGATNLINNQQIGNWKTTSERNDGSDILNAIKYRYGKRRFAAEIVAIFHKEIIPGWWGIYCRRMIYRG